MSRPIILISLHFFSQVNGFVTVLIFSAIVTENEKALLAEALDSPKPPSGFVKSMCKLYADWSPKRGSLNRSNSFSGQESSPNEEETKSSPPQSKGSFKLFRSNSWSSRRKSKTEVKISPTIENQRCSPSYSTKSQDSGFSETAVAAAAAASASATTTNAAQSIQSQRLQFLR